MLCCRRRATHVGSSLTSDCVGPSFIVFFVLLSFKSCCCIAHSFIEIDPEDATQYYHGVAYDGSSKYKLSLSEEPVTVLLGTVPNSEFKTKVWAGLRGKAKNGSLLLDNGWTTGCQLRFDFAETSGGLRNWTVYEKGGSEPFHRLTRMEVYENYSLLRKGNRSYPGLAKADGVQLGWDSVQPVPIQDCVLESENLGNYAVYNLTFTASGDASFSVEWDSKNTTFLRLEAPTTRVPSEEPTIAKTTPNATEPTSSITTPEVTEPTTSITIPESTEPEEPTSPSAETATTETQPS